MGGPGSGQRPQKLCVADCRSLSIGELVAGARRQTPPAGEIVWRGRRSGATLARLSYTISAEHWPDGLQLEVLALRYWPTLDASESRERIILAGPARPGLAFCPNCDRPLRKLYAPPGAEHFLCRTCHGLIYRARPRPNHIAELQAAMGPLLGSLYDHRALEEPQTPAQGRRALAELLSSVEVELPLASQELRLWCLCLARAGLSCRAIARHTGASKSSVQRYLAAGRAAVDRVALTRERLERYHEGQLPSLAGLSLRTQAHLLGRHTKRLGLQRSSAEPEERVFL